MASFAKIGLNNKVIEVISVNNNVLKDADGIEQEVNGIDFLTKLLVGQFGNKHLIILMVECILQVKHL
jgi:hypothetical protein